MARSLALFLTSDSPSCAPLATAGLDLDVNASTLITFPWTDSLLLASAGSQVRRVWRLESAMRRSRLCVMFPLTRGTGFLVTPSGLLQGQV